MSRQKANTASGSSANRGGNFTGSGSRPTQTRESASRQRFFRVVTKVIPPSSSLSLQSSGRPNHPAIPSVARDLLARGEQQIPRGARDDAVARSEEHTYELQSLMRISYAVF